jgi:hypothetical protein
VQPDSCFSAADGRKKHTGNKNDLFNPRANINQWFPDETETVVIGAIAADPTRATGRNWKKLLIKHAFRAEEVMPTPKASQGTASLAGHEAIRWTWLSPKGRMDLFSVTRHQIQYYLLVAGPDRQGKNIEKYKSGFRFLP